MLLLQNANVLEIHYWLQNDSHTMDAIVENKCEREILEIIKEIASIYSIEIRIETEPTAEGGLKKWLTIVSKEENAKATITTTIIVALLTVLLTTPIAKVSEKVIDKIFEDTELQDLEKEKIKLEIEKLKDEAAERNKQVNNNVFIKKRKSNFYEMLNHYSKITKVSFSSTTENKINFSQEKTVYKDEFKNFIIVNDDLEPIELEAEVIEIIAPVLKKGKYKWIGYYNDEIISFNMQSNEFKTLVQKGEIEFKNGSSINCSLIVRKKVDNEGLEKIVGYDVLRVNHYFQNDKPIETSEGKKHRQIKEAIKNQTRMFDSDLSQLED
ncbi:hypothetical protein MCETHM1_02307 [Flavobacteriaceae bacterium]